MGILQTMEVAPDEKKKIKRGVMYLFLITVESSSFYPLGMDVLCHI